MNGGWEDIVTLYVRIGEEIMLSAIIPKVITGDGYSAIGR